MLLDLDPIEQRAAAATAGPWKRSYGLDDVRVLIVRCGPYPYPETDHIGMIYGNSNADFLCHARQDVPALVAEVRRLRELVKELEDALVKVRP